MGSEWDEHYRKMGKNLRFHLWLLPSPHTSEEGLNGVTEKLNTGESLQYKVNVHKDHKTFFSLFQAQMSKITLLEHRMMTEFIDYRLRLTKIMHRIEKWFGKTKHPINDHHLK